MGDQFEQRPGGATGRMPNGGGEDKEVVTLAGAASQSTLESVPRSAYTVKEVAYSLKVTERFIREQIATKKIKTFRLGRCVRISTSELERLVSGG